MAALTLPHTFEHESASVAVEYGNFAETANGTIALHADALKRGDAGLKVTTSAYGGYGRVKTDTFTVAAGETVWIGQWVNQAVFHEGGEAVSMSYGPYLRSPNNMVCGIQFNGYPRVPGSLNFGYRTTSDVVVDNVLTTTAATWYWMVISATRGTDGGSDGAYTFSVSADGTPNVVSNLTGKNNYAGMDGALYVHNGIWTYGHVGHVVYFDDLVITKTAWPSPPASASPGNSRMLLGVG